MVGENHLEPVDKLGRDRFGVYVAAFMQVYLNPDVLPQYVDLIYGTDS